MDRFLVSLRGHKLLATLIVVQMALSYPLLLAMGTLAWQAHARMHAASGIGDEAHLLTLRLSGRVSAAAAQREAAALRAVPGIMSVAAINQLPFGPERWNTLAGPRAGGGGGQFPVAAYLGGPGLLETLGLRLRQGRDFAGDDYRDIHSPDALVVAPRIILTQALAARMFPRGDALGQAVHLGHEPPATVVGIVERLRAPGDGDEDSVILPLRIHGQGATLYALRVAPGDAAPVRARLQANADRIAPGRMHELSSAGDVRSRQLRTHRHRLALLAAGAALWLAGTVAAVYALTEAMVRQRYRQIALRRALGARAAQIRWHLRRENLLLCGLGIAAGVAATALLRRALLDPAALSAPPPYALATALLLLGAGWLAMRGPAARAARLSPAAYR
ncbi:ABC transporter permease [Xanthomonas sp. AmX2]|uniref:FtsX-like permease family protein n=1 Tax=Xanthomonas sp. TaxID=29446 RepID=UPI00197E1AC3|nr:FtsX-like permease family protein [Xanthomonas sp.]MBN6150415.1 ABC transporter permease [Xanthomonas sp.]